MGRKLFTIGSRQGPPMFLFVLAVLCVVAAVPFALDTRPSAALTESWSYDAIVGAVLFGLAGVLTLAGWVLLWRRTTFFERGVIAHVGIKRLHARYADLKWFSLSELDVPGKPLRQSAIRFCTRNGIVFGAIVQSAAGATDERIVRAKAVACDAIAARMETELRLKQRVPWIYHANDRVATELTPDGVLVTTSQGMIPYKSLEVKLAGSEFTLLYNGHQLFAGNTGAANFYPGMTLIEKMKAASAQPSAVR